jgi:hypothetical protein
MSGKHEDGQSKIAIRAALIGLAGAVLAAVIGGVFLLLQPRPNSEPGGPQFSILNDSFSVVNGEQDIKVTGMAHNLTPGEQIYAVAGHSGTAPPWYPGGPAFVGTDGIWMTEIKGIPASAGGLSVWPVVGTPPQPACPFASCAITAINELLHDLEKIGLRSSLLKRVGPGFPAPSTRP